MPTAQYRPLLPCGGYDGSYENQGYCEAFDGGNATATYGPSRSAAGNGGRPPDDPDGSSQGPTVQGSYELYPPEDLKDGQPSRDVRTV